MSTRTVRLDDLTDEILDDGPPVRFAFKGVEYEIDLSPKHRQQLLAALAPFVDAARRASYRTTALPRALPAKRR